MNARFFRVRRTEAWTVCVLVGTASANAQFHEGDIGVGRTASGQLKVTNIPHSPPVILPAVSGLLNGFANNEPGFDRVDVDDAGADLFVLQSGAQIKLRMLQVDPAFKIWSNTFAAVLDAPGEEFPLGNELLHYHGTWHIDSTAPGYDPEQPFWEAAFVLVDSGTTGYLTSAPFVVRFTNRAIPVPTMSEWGVMVTALGMANLGTLLLRRRNSERIIRVSEKVPVAFIEQGKELSL